MTQRTILLIFLCISASTLIGQKSPKYKVVFGEHVNYVKYNVEQEFHIHLDQNGDYYPEIEISDELLKEQSEGELHVWAQRFPEDFIRVAKHYDLDFELYSERNYRTLQASIVHHIVDEINLHSKDKYQTWLVHGFRKNLYQSPNAYQSTSYNDNQNAKKIINDYFKAFPDKSPYYVEVYWDGKYTPFKNIFSPIKMARLFKRAITNAERCGYALRAVFNGLDSKEIDIITHSTGTHLATSLLYNVNKRGGYKLATPEGNIEVLLVASASSGKKLFKNYYSRVTDIPFQSRDNYHIVNVFNEKDNVLISNLFYPFRASTKLGCNRRNESHKLAEAFKENFPNSRYTEIELKHTGRMVHKLYSYTNDPEFRKALELIY